MGATLATEALYDTFRGPKERALLYGHTFAGNPLGAALAREVLAIYRDEGVLEQVAAKATRIERAMREAATLPGVGSPRALGMMGAVDLAGHASPFEGEASDYLGALGWRVYREARARGAYLRPLGNTVYLCPPLTIPEPDLDRLLAIMLESIEVTTRKNPT
jgi:adenosylmethionine-8-amino-7-oxononanoate aminotransferase